MRRNPDILPKPLDEAEKESGVNASEMVDIYEKEECLDLEQAERSWSGLRPA